VSLTMMTRHLRRQTAGCVKTGALKKAIDFGVSDREIDEYLCVHRFVLCVVL